MLHNKHSIFITLLALSVFESIIIQNAGAGVDLGVAVLRVEERVDLWQARNVWSG